MSTYVETIRQIIVTLVKRGANVVLISTCQGVPEYWTDDSETGMLVVCDLPSDVKGSVSVDREHYAPDDLILRLEDFDLVVATRMHMAILALCAGVPVFPIAYETKTSELFSKFDLASWVQDIDALDPILTSERLIAFLAALPTIRGSLFQRVNEEYHSALEVADLLNEYVGPRDGERPS